MIPAKRRQNIKKGRMEGRKLTAMHPTLQAVEKKKVKQNKRHRDIKTSLIIN